MSKTEKSKPLLRSLYARHIYLDLTMIICRTFHSIFRHSVELMAWVRRFHHQSRPSVDSVDASCKNNKTRRQAKRTELRTELHRLNHLEYSESRLKQMLKLW